MKPLTLTCVLTILILQAVKSQDSLKTALPTDTAVQGIFYKAIIYMTNFVVAKGYLVTVKDSSVYISQTKKPLSFDHVNPAYLKKIDYRSIGEVKINKSHAMGTSILVGALLGVVTGAVIGYASGDDSEWFGLTAGEKAFVGGIIGGGAGTLVGALIGKTSEKKFLINGEWESLQEMKEDLQNRK
jgi:hypothetical protein